MEAMTGVPAVESQPVAAGFPDGASGEHVYEGVRLIGADMDKLECTPVAA